MHALDIFGMAGLAFSLIAMGQVSELKKEIDRLRAQIGEEGGVENAPDHQH